MLIKFLNNDLQVKYFMYGRIGETIALVAERLK